MKWWMQMKLALLLVVYKFGKFTGNLAVQHLALEEMVLFNTRMRVLKEQRENQLLFSRARMVTEPAF